MLKLLSQIKQRIYPTTGDNSVSRLSATLAVEGLLAAIILNLGSAYSQMFASRMGATDSQIALITALPQLLALLVLIPGALLASRIHDRRRPVEVAVIMTGILYGIAGFSPWLGDNRVWFLIGIISLANVPLVLYNTTWQSYFSDVVPIVNRNSVYAFRMSMTFIAGIVILQATGIMLGSAQSDAVRIWLYQGCYWLALIVSIVQLRVLRRAPPDLGDHVATGLKDLLAAGRELLKCKGFIFFTLISFFFHAGWYMAWPLFFLVQVDYMGANETWLALITVPASIVQWLTVRPWSRFIERHGIRMTLIIGSVGLAANPMLAVLAASMPPDLRLPVMLVFNIINGFTFSAFQLSILQCMLEAVPVRFRTINISVYTTILLVANAATPMLGIQIYELLGADMQAMVISMAVSSVIRLIGAGLFLLRWHLMRKIPDCGMIS